MQVPASRPTAPLPAVGAVVLHEDAVLLVRRGQPPLQGRWTLPGGRIELGERAEEALRRELREETGLEVEVLRLLDVVELIERDEAGEVSFHYVILDYLARYRAGRLRAGSDSEQARWVRCEALACYELSPQVRELIRRGFAAA